MDFRERLNNYLTLTLIPALRRMFGKHRKSNTILLICTFFLISAMLSVICLSYHVNLKENDRLAAEYEQYITSATTSNDTESSEAAAQAFNHILASKIELTSVFVFLMIVWGILSTFALARVFHATIEQDKYTYGLYVTFGSDTRRIRRQIHTEFILAALIALAAAIPIATWLTRAVYVQNGQTFRPGTAPFVQILLWLFAVSLIGAAYLSHRITNSTCVELMAALDCSDYITSPRTSRLFGKKLYNGSLRYARLAILRMRGYYIPLVLTVSLVAAVFFGSMNLALEGERTSAESIHEYTVEFSKGVSGKELTEGYLNRLLEVEDVESVAAVANGSAEMLGTHLLAEKSLFANGASEHLIDQGQFYATDDIRILCADSNTRTELGSDVILPAPWKNENFTFQELTFNYGQIPNMGSVVYMYPEERESELKVSIGDTLRLALPRGEASGATLEEKIADGSYEYLSLTVSDVVAVPGIYQSTMNDATYICPRITEDYLLLNPEDYTTVTQSETVETLALDELYREEFAFGELTSPAVLLLPEGYPANDLTSILMVAPTEKITERYSVTDPLDSSNTIYLESDIFTRNLTAPNTYFYLGTTGSFHNDAAASEQANGLLKRQLIPYTLTELTVVDQIVCPGLDAPCVILPNDDNFFSSYSGDMCVLRLGMRGALYGVSEEIFAFGTDQALTLDDYLGRQLFLHTEIEAGFFDEMKAQGLYTTYEDESAYALSKFSIQSLFDLNGYIYFVCALTRDCNLGMDGYPAYMAPGNDFIFREGLYGATDLALPDSDSYLMFAEELYKKNSNIESTLVGTFAATNNFTVSVADSINAEILTPGLTSEPPTAGVVTLVRTQGSDLAKMREGDFIQLAIRTDIVRDPNDPQTASLEGIALLEYLLNSNYRYISLEIGQVIEGERDVLYLAEEDWGRICRTDGTYQSIDIHLFGDTDLVSLIKTASRIRALMGNWQSVENRVTLVEHNRLWQAVTTGACNYPAIIRILSIMLILLLPLLWCTPQMVHFRKRRSEFEVMNAIGKTDRQLRRMIAAECLLITFAAGAFVALLCPFSLWCVQAAIYLLELPFETSSFDMRAYLFMIAFVMLCSAISFLAASRHLTERAPKPEKQPKGADS